LLLFNIFMDYLD